MAERIVKSGSLDPQMVNDGVWYYEEGRYITVCVDAEQLDPIVCGSFKFQFKIPLRMLEKSLARMPKKRRPA